MHKKKVIILGTNGMLGSMVASVFSREKDLQVVLTARDAKTMKKISITHANMDIDLLHAEKSLGTFAKKHADASVLINCVGIIKPFIHDDNPLEVERAIRVNALFPHQLAKAFSQAKILQIATDCVFSGKEGKYTEEFMYDAYDVYGKTKSLGESYHPNMHHLRCSIIGPEKGTTKSLLEWFRSQPSKAKLNGYTNHYWNGITTLQFAKICLGIIKNNISLGHMQHIIPADAVSKYQLLQIFQKAYDRHDLQISASKAKISIDRTLATINQKQNIHLWQSAGYEKIPTVEEMIEELVAF